MHRLILVALLGFAAASAACASAQAKAPADRPTLEVPAPPTRTIEPTPRPEPTVEPVPDLPPAAPPSPRPRPAATNREPVRTEPKPEAPPPEPVVSAPAPVPPPTQLRTPGAVDGAEADRQVRTVIENARRTLGSIDYRRLSKARQKEYDDAGRLIAQAEDHLKTASFELARNLAEKADGIAKELKGR